MASTVPVRRFILAILVGAAALLVLAAPMASQAAPSKPPPARIHDGVVIVGFEAGTSAGAKSTSIGKANGKVKQTLKLETVVVDVGKGNVNSAIKALKADKNVRYAEPDYIVSIATDPNDPSYGQLWGMENTGQVIGGTGGVVDADVDADQAWDTTTGSADVVVGVVDTGIKWDHPDLAANVWSNPGGIGGCAAGTHGYNAIAETCDPMDDHDHGTHVSGTIGAVGNNGVGVAGVNWTTSIIGLKAFDATGNANTTDIVQALDWVLSAKAAGVNIRVLNNSWGDFTFSQATLDRINALGAADILFMAAAGNFGFPNDLFAFYPCNYDAWNVVCVGATNNTDDRAYFSNYGQSVDVGAPGQGILSTIRSGYGYFDGTSMATPHVTGAAALLLSTGDYTGAQVENALLTGADHVAKLDGDFAGGRRLNLSGMLTAAGNEPPPPPPPPPGLPAAPSLSALAGDASVGLTWTTPDPGDSPITGYNVYRGTTAGNIALLDTVGLVNDYTDPTATNGTTYSYQVSAVSALGEGAKSAVVTATPVTAPVPPSAPSVYATPGNGVADVCWTAPYDGNSAITAYRVYRDGLQVAQVGGTARDQVDGVPNGGLYQYEVAAVNAVGEGPRGAAGLVSLPGPPPSVASFSPTIVAAGGTVDIAGGSFGDGVCGNQVTFGGSAGTVTQVSGASLRATLPVGGAGAGKVTVTTVAGSATSTADLYVVPSGSAPADVQFAQRMTFPGTIKPTVTTSGKIALVEFDGSVGHSFSLAVTGVTVSSTDLSIINPNGSTLLAPTALGTGGVFVDTRALTQAGTYTIVLNPRSTYTGSWNLSLYDVPPDAARTTSPGGGPVSIGVGTPGQNAQVTFSGIAGRSISLNVTGVTASSSDISILNPNGTALAPAVGVGTGGSFFDTRLLGQTGTYTIVINPRTNSTGSWTLNLYDVPGDALGTTSPGGGSMSIGVGIPGQNAKVTFSGVAGRWISLNVTGVTASSSDISILNPNGTALAPAVAVGTGGVFFDTRMLPQTGTYTIVINPRTTSTGSWTLSLYDIPPDVTGTVSVGGAPTTISVAIPGQNAQVTFSGIAGQALTLVVNGVSITQSDISVRRPDNSNLVAPTLVGTGGRTFTFTA
ncbi:MAG: S8 family serine peptidase, partial [Chloroflexota bacterium]